MYASIDVSEGPSHLRLRQHCAPGSGGSITSVVCVRAGSVLRTSGVV